MNPATILIVDDEPSLRKSTALLLEKKGYTVTCASTAEEGWEKIQRIPPTLVLLDVLLPDFDGRDLCRRIKADPNLEKVFVILISGAFLSPEDQISGFEAGADSYLNRPLQSDVLLAHIQALLRIRTREIALKEKDRALENAQKAAMELMEDVNLQRQRLQQARQQLEESAQSLRMLSRAVEDSPVSVIITDRQGRIEYINPHFTHTTGYTSQEAIGQSPRLRKSGWHPAEFYKTMWETLLAGHTWRGEICNRKKNNDVHWESAAISSIRNPAGEITHFVAIFEDITERKQLESELRQAKDAAETANRAKSAFLANMSHEIRTPMNAILGYSQLLQRDPSLSPAAAESLSIINRSGEHLLHLIDDVLEMSKIEAGRISLSPAAFNLPSLLTDLGSMFRLRTETKGLAFEILCQGEVPSFLLADEGKLRQVLVNLLGNAIKFTERGSVSLRVSSRREISGQLWLTLEIEDTGIGIAQEEIGKLFTFFEQTASGRHLQCGTGLGLAISREYVRLMGGDITVSSQWQKGTLFRFEIPIKTAPSNSTEKPNLLRRVVGLKPNQGPIRILLADADQDNRDWLSKLLTTVGFEVREVTEGRAAIQEWQQWNPQMILMGVVLPGMNGFDAIRTLRALPGGKVPVIFVVTASVFDEIREAALEAGANTFLPKPLKETELFEKIQQSLHLEYLYAYLEPDLETAEAPKSEIDTKSEALQKIPPDLLNSMRYAIQNGDMEQLRKHIGKTACYDQPFSKILHNLADQYEFDAMFQLLAGEAP